MGWLNLLADAGRLDVLDALCPGKVQTMIAGDVAHWHQSSGDDAQHKDTLVWATLPLPWRVLEGEVCTRSDVEDACLSAGVDPSEGWTMPKRSGVIELTEPTPELVHGVTVGSPLLAQILRRSNVFSGKKVSVGPLLDASIPEGEL